MTGAYGVEGRFPFLDASVVQEQLYLSTSLKNTYYKAEKHVFSAYKGANKGKIQFGIFCAFFICFSWSFRWMFTVCFTTWCS